MTKKEIRKTATAKINEGKTHQQVFDELRESSRLPGERIAKVIRYIPTSDSKQKYKVPNVVLGTILIITALLKIISSIPIIIDMEYDPYLLVILILLVPSINIILAVGVLQFKSNYYRLVVILTILGILRSVKYLKDIQFNTALLVDFGFIVILIGLGSYLGSKLIVDYKVKSVRYISDDGRQKIRQDILFLDHKQ